VDDILAEIEVSLSLVPGGDVEREVRQMGRAQGYFRAKMGLISSVLFYRPYKRGTDCP
jgi:hypothetical protein